MNILDSRRQKQFSWCMGRMINLLDLSAGMPGTKLLSERAHRDGSPTQRNISDGTKKPLDPVGADNKEKPMVNELRRSSSNKKSGGTPMKMLLAHEMSKEMDPKKKIPSVVAKLMGLDAMPSHQPFLNAQRSMHEDYSDERAASDSHLVEGCYFSSPLPCRTQSYVYEKEYKDVYEVWQQPSQINCIKDQPPRKERSNDNSNEKRMALVRQKFMEAKRLATDEKLLQSKEFQDALEVLSSNRDLFLKFLEEPNPLFSKHLAEMQSIPLPFQTKRITVLKPSKAIDMKGVNQAKMQQHLATDEHARDMYRHRRCSSLDYLKAENLSQPTRIVVLKPSPRKHCDFKAVATSQISLPKSLEERDFGKDFEVDESIGSRRIAKEINQQIRETMNSNRRDDSLLSSVLSNGYVGDKSSFNISEHEYTEEAVGNLSDSEIATPTSRHSWDYMNRFGSPYSFSSASRASYSPESSVIREAKKRLSERWALVTSNGVVPEQKQVRRSSNTLGEMLAIPEVRKEEESSKELDFTSCRSCGREEDPKTYTACLSLVRPSGATDESSPTNLSRSKSVPVSSSTYNNIELNVGASYSPVSNSTAPKEEMKSRSGKSSFKGKVSSLFLSRNKKSSKVKSIPSSSEICNDRLKSGDAEVAGKKDGISNDVQNNQPEERSFSLVENSMSTFLPSAPANKGSQNGTVPAKATLSLEKPCTSERPGENQEQPSPVSVLEASFEDDPKNIASQFSQSLLVGHLQALSRSPPIESLARCLSWEDTCMEALTPNHLKHPRSAFRADEEDEERFDFVQKLLSSASLESMNSKNIFTRWHSLDSPLDQMLLYSFLDLKEEETNCKEKRSSQRLLFDCVNAALLEIGRAAIFKAHTKANAYDVTQISDPACSSLSSEVWSVIRDWFSGEGTWWSAEVGNSSAIVDRVVRKEVVGREWTVLWWGELDELSKEIELKVLEELVEEALCDFTDWCL